MFRKSFCGLILALTLSNTTGPLMFSITASNQDIESIKEMYAYKNELIVMYQDMITGVSEEEVIDDLLTLYPNMSYENNKIKLVLDEGKGKTITGELKKDYCDVEIKPTSFFGKLFK